MTGLDTNVLIRHLTRDDPVQSPKATRLIERTLTEEAPGFVNIVVIAETAWVLERAPTLTRERFESPAATALKVKVATLP